MVEQRIPEIQDRRLDYAYRKKDTRNNYDSFASISVPCVFISW